MISGNPVPPAAECPSRRAEEGSAYLAVLMLLVVLTILGLSLSVITQTEVIIGGSERQTTRQVFNAASALNLSAVHELVNRNSAGRMMILGRRNQNFFGEATTIGDRVCTTPFFQIQAGTCNLCTMNQDTNFFAVQNAVTANALRHGDDELAARRQVGSVVALEPWERSFTAFSMGGDERLTDTLTIDVNPSTETDPCEGLILRI
jgi:Tfp pilus assembly protein PilX